MSGTDQRSKPSRAAAPFEARNGESLAVNGRGGGTTVRVAIPDPGAAAAGLAYEVVLVFAEPSAELGLP